MFKYKKSLVAVVIGILAIPVAVYAYGATIRVDATTSSRCNDWDNQTAIWVNSGTGCYANINTGNCDFIVEPDGSTECVCRDCTMNGSAGDCDGGLGDVIWTRAN